MKMFVRILHSIQSQANAKAADGDPAGAAAVQKNENRRNWPANFRGDPFFLRFKRGNLFFFLCGNGFERGLI